MYYIKRRVLGEVEESLTVTEVDDETDEEIVKVMISY
jgi:hypothetical protein